MAHRFASRPGRTAIATLGLLLALTGSALAASSSNGLYNSCISHAQAQYVGRLGRCSLSPDPAACRHAAGVQRSAELSACQRLRQVQPSFPEPSGGDTQSGHGTGQPQGGMHTQHLHHGRPFGFAPSEKLQLQ